MIRKNLNFLIVVLFISFYCSTQAQNYGSWVLPLYNDSDSPPVEKLDFINGNISGGIITVMIDEDIFNLRCSSGAYDTDGNLLFFVVNNNIYYGANFNVYEPYTELSIDDIAPEIQIIPKPEDEDNYYIFYSTYPTNNGHYYYTEIEFIDTEINNKVMDIKLEEMNIIFPYYPQDLQLQNWMTIRRERYFVV